MSISTLSLLLLGFFFIGLLHGSDAVLVDDFVANDWTTPSLRGSRVFALSSINYVIYQSEDPGLPLRATQHTSASACISGSCPSFVLANNTENDIIVASDNNIYCRSKSGGSLFRVSQTGTNRVTYTGSVVSTAGQFFFVSNGADSGVLYRQNSNGEMNYVLASDNSPIDTSSPVGSSAYPTGSTARNPIATRSTNVDLYWVNANNLYYQLIGSGAGGVVNITTSISAISNFRPFTSNGRYYLVQTRDSSSVYSLWLVDPTDISAPILVSTGLNNVAADQYLITSGTNIIVFLGQASPGDPYTLYRFRTATLDSTPTQIAASSVLDGSNLVAGSSDNVFVTSGTSLLIVNANSNTLTGNITGITSNAKYTTFGSTLLAVLSDTAGGTLRVFDYNGDLQGSQVASNAVNFVAGTAGNNLLYTIVASGSQGLYRVASPWTSSTLLTPSSLSTADAAAMSYIIHNGPSRALFYIPSSKSLYSVPIAGCTYLTSITGPTTPSISASCPGDTVALTVTPNAGASNPVYQWQINSGSWVNVAGATSATFSPTVGATTQYRVLVSGDCLDDVFRLTNSVTVTPTGNGTITGQPTFTSPVCPSATAVTLSVTTTSPGGTTTYQWRRDGTIIAGANSTSYAFARTNANSGVYTCDVTWPCNSRTTNSLTVTINRNTAISEHPANATVCGNLDSHTFSVTATGTSLTYRWFKDGALISGATDATYTITNLLALVGISSNYYVEVTGACGVLTSHTAYLEVLPGSVPSITYQPIDKTVCPGAEVRFHVKATGVALSYDWYFGPTLLAETSPNLNISNANASHAGDYRCEVKTSICTVQPSRIASLTVADFCGNLTSVIFYIGSQTLASWNATFRDTVFLPGIVGVLSDLGFTFTQSDIIIVSVKDGSVIVEFSLIGADSAAALQALLDIWNLELTEILPENGLTTVTDIKAGSAVVIIPTTSGSSSGGDGDSDNTGAIVGGVVGGVLGFAVLCICIVLLVLLVVFLVKALKGGGGLKVGGGKKWKQQNWWEEDDL